MSNPISRRSMLKGVSLGAGALLLNQWITQSIAHAEGDTKKIPRRVIFIVQDNGISPSHFVPVGVPHKDGQNPNKTKSFTELPLENAELSASIAALTPFKKRMTIIQGLSGKATDAGSGGHSSDYGALGCYRGSLGPVAQTIDSALADAVGGVVPHVTLGLANSLDKTLTYNISARGPGKALPMQCNPLLAHKSIFGSVAEGSGRQAFDLKTNLLNYMTDDVKRVREALPGQERQRMDSYLDSFSALYERQGKLADRKEQLKSNAPGIDAKFSSSVECQRLEAQFTTAAAALISGVTNAVTISTSGGGQQYITYTGIGINVGGHSLGHGSGDVGKTQPECYALIRGFMTKQIAELARRLEATPEGTGNMLDNSLIVYLSDSGESHHPRFEEWPVLMIGNLGGRLKTQGRYLQYPTYRAPGHRTMSSLYQSMLHAAGTPRDTFGTEDTGLRDLKGHGGPLTELLA